MLNLPFHNLHKLRCKTKLLGQKSTPFKTLQKGNKVYRICWKEGERGIGIISYLQELPTLNWTSTITARSPVHLNSGGCRGNNIQTWGFWGSYIKIQSDIFTMISLLMSAYYLISIHNIIHQ